MFGLGPATRIYLAAGVTDMRKGFEGLFGLVSAPLPPRITLVNQLAIVCASSIPSAPADLELIAQLKSKLQ